MFLNYAYTALGEGIFMTDNLSKENRIKNMRAIKSQSKLENRVSRALWNKGARFRKNDRSLYGIPDISIKKYKLVIFIDSCFWHMCPVHGNLPKSNEQFWKEKLYRNVERDIEVTLHYLEAGWNIIRIWEHDLKKDFEITIEKIYSFIMQEKSKKTDKMLKN